MAEPSNPSLCTRNPSVSFPMQRRDRGIAQALASHPPSQTQLLQKVKESRVLVVGAGGIGCELLKNLVCCGFGSAPEPVPAPATEDSRSASLPPEIVVVDLDTIDVSNLNRQFLFRKQHIAQPKAFVAKQTASQFNPSVNIDAHHGSIFDNRYDVEFFEGFDLVFNALDNLAARRHVNKMCLAADVPLIESGTTGFNGQVQAIRKGVTQCYDCNPKPVQKSFPICTIRSTPSQPIHCIVWAKSYLLPELFGASDEDVKDVTVTDSDNAEEVAKLKEEAEALKKIRGTMGKSEFAEQVFNKVFHDDIERLRSMTEMWQSRKPPESLKFDALSEGAAVIKQGFNLAHQDQKTWSLLENISVFCYSLDALCKRLQSEEMKVASIEFDKDDKVTLDFVASAANLRSYVFGIQLYSEWDIKQMAGNIIPAIATSNALTASLCVFQAFKILRTLSGKSSSAVNSAAASTNDNHTNNHAKPTPNSTKAEEPLGGAKEVFLSARSTERIITSHPLYTPLPGCPVCSPVYAKLHLPPIDSKCPPPTLQDLVTLLKHRIGYDEFSLNIEDVGVIYEPDLDDNLSEPLSKWAVGQNIKFLTVSDDNDGPRVDLLLSAKIVPTATQLTLLPENIELPLKPPKLVEAPDTVAPSANGDAQETTTRGVKELSLSPGGKKRKRDATEVDGDEEPAAKKKAMAEDGKGITVIEDDGAILLD